MCAPRRPLARSKSRLLPAAARIFVLPLPPEHPRRLLDDAVRWFGLAVPTPTGLLRPRGVAGLPQLFDPTTSHNRRGPNSPKHNRRVAPGSARPQRHQPCQHAGAPLLKGAILLARGPCCWTVPC